ncbi:RNA-directed DNA polymerase, eukaryota, reverse transcriptase zinc-binding domain protein [Tanacetum coccineum]
MLLFKVNFEKAFDTVSWKYLDFMLHSLGFGLTWRSWIKSCLESSRTSVLINGSPTSEFNVRRGLRQGDPLSSFLFIIIMEGLYVAISDSTHQASGLKINIHKSNVYGIGVSSEEVHHMASNTGCAAGSFPFRYLGLPIGCNMSLTANWKPLIDKFKGKLSTWKAIMLSFGGRFTLIKSILGSLGIYYLSIFKALEMVLKSLENMRAAFFWGGTIHSRKLAWVKWQNIVASFKKGGLNIRSLKAFNLALLQKWRWRIFSNSSALWVNVIKALHGSDGGFSYNGCSSKGLWAQIVGSSNYLHSSNILPIDSIRFQVGCGSQVRFWKDIWLGSSPLCTRFSRLFRLKQDKDCLIMDRIANGQWVWNWSSNLGVRNTAHLNELLLDISPLNIQVDTDKCLWFLDKEGAFAVAPLRRLIDDITLPSLDFPTSWDNAIPRRLHIFMWRLKIDKLPHRLNLFRRGIEILVISCPSCNSMVESNQHVFFNCDITKDIWRIVHRWCEDSFPIFDSIDHCLDWWNSWLVSSDKKHHLYVIIVTTLWFTWRYRNNVTFNSQSLRKSDIFDNIRLFSFSWLKYRGRMYCSWSNWLNYPL